MECPNNCNGHGTCQYLDDVNSNYADWDAHRIQICQCDPGYEGHDCSQRMCKPGDDPLTVATGNQYSVQSISIIGPSAGEFLVSYQDWRGETWRTWALPYDTTALYMQQALRAMPNAAMEGVEVTKSASNVWDVTFAGSHLTGNQPSLVVEHAGCDYDGCQPRYTALTASGAISVTQFTTADAEVEFATCSNRGKCNPSTGLCECFSGYHGESCNGQTVIR